MVSLRAILCLLLLAPALFACSAKNTQPSVAPAGQKAQEVGAGVARGAVEALESTTPLQMDTEFDEAQKDREIAPDADEESAVRIAKEKEEAALKADESEFGDVTDEYGDVGDIDEEYDDLDAEYDSEYAEEMPVAAVPDPIENFNRAMFTFNDHLYFYVLKPAAIGWKHLFFRDLRSGIRNAFYNVRFPIRFLSNLFQGNFEGMGQELGQFTINTLFGFGGLMRPSEGIEWLNPDPQDMGTTYGKWGMPHGFYIVLPVLGPSSGRDALGLATDYWFDPLSYIGSFFIRPELWYMATSLQVGEKINNTTFVLGDYETLKQMAVDPYAAVRDAYLQLRENKLGKAITPERIEAEEKAQEEGKTQ